MATTAPKANGALKRSGGLLGFLDRLLRGPATVDPVEAFYERLGRLEHRMEMLELNWETTYKKILGVLGSLRKAEKRANGELELEQPAPPAPPAPHMPNAAERFRLNNLRRH